jgi:hypothetical protein
MRKFWRLAIRAVAAGLLGSWKYISEMAEKTQSQTWYTQGITSLKYWIPIILAALLIVNEIWDLISQNLSRDILKKFLDHLHRKHFPNPDGGSRPEFRLTLFTPGYLKRNHLVVRSRSGGMLLTSRVKWSIKKSEAGEYDGLAGYSWATEIFVPLHDLPDYDACSEEEKAEYRRKTYISAKKINKLHWKARSYCSLIVKNQRGKKVGVLMMESKLPDGLKDIKATTLNTEAEYLQFVLG